MDVVAMDFSKTFGKVSHNRLNQNIKMHEIHSELVVWFQTVLVRRQGSSGNVLFWLEVSDYWTSAEFCIGICLFMI